MENGCVAVSGTDMYYVSFGRGKKTLVVLPGLSDGLATVKGKALVLSAPYRKYLGDYSVYMFSRKNSMPKDYTISQMAEDQALAMKALGIDRAFVLGVSQGGMIAQYLAIDHPEAVEKLILAVTAPYANNTVREAVGAWIEMAERGDHLSLMTDTAERMYSDAFLEKNRKLLPLTARLTKPASYERFFRNAYAILDFDAREELSSVKCPVLIIAGSEDRTVGTEAADDLKECIPESRVYVYEGLGHGLYEEARNFYDRVFDFCEA